MTLFWRLFLSIFAALMLTAGTVAYITHEFRDIPSSEIDPAELGAGPHGLRGSTGTRRARVRVDSPDAAQSSAPDAVRNGWAPNHSRAVFARELAERATLENPRVWIYEAGAGGAGADYL